MAEMNFQTRSSITAFFS
ncbi:hypothetical protein [uncultured Robinsoniella sp.]